MAWSATDILKNVKNATGARSSFLGVDIGASTMKIVQLAVTDNVVTLETYGEISNSIYAEAETGRAVRPGVYAASSELSDLIHELKAQSRTCGVSVSLGETLFNKVDLPKRDPEQMRRIVPAEAKQFIPMAIDKVMLDWYVLPEGEGESVFESLNAHKETEAKFQKVMIVAVKKETALELATVVSGSNLTSEFFEIEMFSVVRASTHGIDVPVMILDFGASATKAYIVNEQQVALAAHLTPVGGQIFTEAVMKTLSSNFPSAERVKCEQGLAGESGAGAAIETALQQVWTFIRQILADHQKSGGKMPQRILMTGGGSYMPGLIDLVAKTLMLPVELADAFNRTKGPMILEKVLREEGARYAVAVGLALRGVGK